MIKVEVDVIEYIDVALAMMLSKAKADVLDMYLSLLQGQKLNSTHFSRYQTKYHEEGESIIDDTPILDMLNNLELKLIEGNLWE